MDLAAARSGDAAAVQRERSRFMRAIQPLLQHDGPKLLVTDSQVCAAFRSSYTRCCQQPSISRVSWAGCNVLCDAGLRTCHFMPNPVSNPDHYIRGIVYADLSKACILDIPKVLTHWRGVCLLVLLQAMDIVHPWTLDDQGAPWLPITTFSIAMIHR
jgi:hypothetical protein